MTQESQNALVTFVTNLISVVTPDVSDIERHIHDLKKANPSLSQNKLAEKWADTICQRYASLGAVTALPSAIPGLGTAVQVGVEAGGISTDLAYMGSSQKTEKIVR